MKSDNIKEDKVKSDNIKEDKAKQREEKIKKALLQEANLVLNKPKKDKTNRLPVSVFFSGSPELHGFYIAFILMIIFPFTSFFLSRYILTYLGFNKKMRDVYSVICTLVSVWIILIVYCIWYFKEDFVKVFGNKKKNQDLDEIVKDINGSDNKEKKNEKESKSKSNNQNKKGKKEKVKQD